jgi:hypothetical protein
MKETAKTAVTDAPFIDEPSSNPKTTTDNYESPLKQVEEQFSARCDSKLNRENVTKMFHFTKGSLNVTSQL